MGPTDLLRVSRGRAPGDFQQIRVRSRVEQVLAPELVFEFLAAELALLLQELGHFLDAHALDIEPQLALAAEVDVGVVKGLPFDDFFDRLDEVSRRVLRQKVHEIL